MPHFQGKEAYCGLHVGANRLYGVCLAPDGRLLAQASSRFRRLEELADSYDRVVEALNQKAPQTDLFWTLGLEKPQRLILAPRNPGLNLVSLKPDVVQPALASVLLGAIPQGPGLLLSLGREVRFALIDSTLAYREYRITEGGGTWWQKELVVLSQHSRRLQTHLSDFSTEEPPLPHLPKLLELGQFPTPDPVLKPRLEKVATRLAEMAQTLTARLPGLKRYCLSGFLARSTLGALVAQNLAKEAPHLRAVDAQFPPEVGSALLGLAQDRENWERDHLGKAPFVQDRTVDEWCPPRVLLRRLFKLRKPFEAYPK